MPILPTCAFLSHRWLRLVLSKAWRVSVTHKEYQLKKALLLAAVVAVAAPQAFAQAKNFEGFSLGANLTAARTTTDLTPVGGATLSDSGNSANLDLQAQYSFAFGQQFVLGMGLTAGVGNNKSGTLGVNDLSTKDRTSFDLMPGFALSDSTLLFGKVSALNATAVADGVGGASTSVSGIGYGLGVRSFIDKNMFFQVGYDFNQYDAKTSGGVAFKPKADIFSLGVGYKF